MCENQLFTLIKIYVSAFKKKTNNIEFFPALFLYAGTLGNDGGYTKTGYPLRSIDGE